MSWTDRIGGRLKPRDLHILLTVAEAGSMTKAAEQLAVLPPVVSKAIAGLEGTLGVRLLDRLPGGVELTPHGRALVRRGRAVFDELRQATTEMAFLSNPGVGTVRIACSEAIAAGLVAEAMDQVARRYPRASFDVQQGPAATILRTRHERRADLVVARIASTDPEITLEPLLHDRLLVVYGAGSSWVARRRRLSLADLADAPWILSSTEFVSDGPVRRAFAAIGQPMPVARVVTGSLALRYRLLRSGDFVSLMPETALRLGAVPPHVRVLPVEMPPWAVPTAVATLKGRTLPPLAELFMGAVREVAGRMPAPESKLGVGSSPS
ncbi:LysR family transcriptional regulator [Roseomonas sp. HF4]|uniref:LysR family transcriptional regulator n=1 Tax=Roseomonas sp. HF4 TaxID=2562313 RepID=UPI0010C080FB|nr:LysR family transcriptional regulator [Roseomonas sp. HF4]